MIRKEDVDAPTSQHIRAIQGPVTNDTRSPSHGHCVWDASLFLSQYFQLEQTRLRPETKSILELGAGVGLVGMTLAAACQAQDVQISDQRPCLPLLHQNIAANETLWRRTKAPKVVELQWGVTQLPHSPVDWIVASDILYLESTFHLLVDTIRTHAHAETEVFICYETRNPDKERRFVQLLMSIGFDDIVFLTDEPSSALIESIQDMLQLPYVDEIRFFRAKQSPRRVS